MNSATTKKKGIKQSVFDLPATVWLTALAIKRPVTTAMLMLSLFVTGLIASKLLPQESWPALNIPVAFINVVCLAYCFATFRKLCC